MTVKQNKIRFQLLNSRNEIKLIKALLISVLISLCAPISECRVYQNKREMLQLLLFHANFFVLTIYLKIFSQMLLDFSLKLLIHSCLLSELNFF